MSADRHPYQAAVDALNAHGGKATTSQKAENLAERLLKLKGYAALKLTKRQAAWVLRRFGETGAIDLTEPSLIRRQYRPLNWPTDKKQSDYMRARRDENAERASTNPNENWMANQIRELGICGKWSRQYAWGYRIYDFFNEALGVAIEVDGPSHKPAYDSFRDVHNFLRSGIVVLRVRNRNADDALKVARFVLSCDSRKERRKKLALSATGQMALVNRWRAGEFDGVALLEATRAAGTVPDDLKPFYLCARSSMDDRADNKSDAHLEIE